MPKKTTAMCKHFKFYTFIYGRRQAETTVPATHRAPMSAKALTN
jgi:hypothetical protein